MVTSPIPITPALPIQMHDTWTVDTYGILYGKRLEDGVNRCCCDISCCTTMTDYVTYIVDFTTVD